MRNELLETVVRGEHKERLSEEYKQKRRLRKDQRFIYDTDVADYLSPDRKDSELAGIIELGVLNDNGEVDRSLKDTPIVIGGREHKLDEGKLRIVDKKTVDDAIIPIMEERRYKDAILSIMLNDRSGRLARLLLPRDRYEMLKAGANLRPIMKGQPVPADVIAADARPEYFSLYAESSAQFALSIHKMSLIVDRTPLAFSEEINDWLTKYGGGRD
jgi:hypothetical protein